MLYINWNEKGNNIDNVYDNSGCMLYFLWEKSDYIMKSCVYDDFKESKLVCHEVCANDQKYCLQKVIEPLNKKRTETRYSSL